MVWSYSMYKWLDTTVYVDVITYPYPNADASLVNRRQQMGP